MNSTPTPQDGAAPAPTPLAPCPFCGKSEFLEILTDSEIHENNEEFFKLDGWGVICSFQQEEGKSGGCGAQGGYGETQEAAAENWNRRAPLESPRPTTAPAVDLTKEITAIRTYIAKSALYYLEDGKPKRKEAHEMAEWGLSRIQHYTRQAAPQEESRGEPAPSAKMEQAYQEIIGVVNDKMLNPMQRRDFILSTLRGVLAHPVEERKIEVADPHIPKGFTRLEAYTNGKTIVILGDIPDEEGIPEELQHSCDTMGCGLGDHVIAKIPDPRGEVFEPSNALNSHPGAPEEAPGPAPAAKEAAKLACTYCRGLGFIPSSFDIRQPICPHCCGTRDEPLPLRAPFAAPAPMEVQAPAPSPAKPVYGIDHGKEYTAEVFGYEKDGIVHITGQKITPNSKGAGGVDLSDLELMDDAMTYLPGPWWQKNQAAWQRLKPFLVAAPQALRYDQMRALDMDGWPDGKLVQLNAKGRYLSAWTPRVYEVVRKSKAAPPSPETPPLVWTREKPKVEGWYWMRWANGAGCIVDVSRYDDHFAIDRGWGYDPFNENMEWAGPICEPVSREGGEGGQ